MHILIILAHPKPGSFNHAIADSVRLALEGAGHQVTLHDLCAEGFDPLFTVEELGRGNVPPPAIRAHADQVLNADGIVVIHPNWWAQAPAILKGWLDRVLRAGEAYRFGTNDKGEGVIIGLLKARAALVFTTANTPQAVEDTLYGDPLDNFWKKCVWGFCGVPRVERRNFTPVIVSSAEQRAAWLAEAAQLALEMLPGNPPPIAS